MIYNFLQLASKKYYEGSPIISDAQFDELADKHDFKDVGYDTKGSSKTGKHYKQMFSLQKYYADEGNTDPLANIKNTSCSPKLDGAAISLLYHKGILVQALTRGDGKVGQDITDKMYATNIVPKVLLSGGNSDFTQISGEIVSSKEIPNSRNYAAGSLNLKDLQEFKTRAIVFIAYDCFPTQQETYDEEMRSLSRKGFETVKDPELHNIYPTDGLVFRVNNHEEAKAMGYTSKHPKFAYALKERQDTVETTILSVEWQTGRSGRVTPVAILNPVMIGDKEVTRATLNNPGFIESLDLCIGDTVAIRLAGMIIPEIVHKVDG